MKSRYSRRPIVLAVMMMTQVAYAQNATLGGQAAGMSELDAMRNLTRDQIESVVEGNPESIDTLTEFGRTLGTEYAVPIAPQVAEADQGSGASGRRMTSLKDAGHPAPPRVSRSSDRQPFKRLASPEPKKEAEREMFAPDFSRQKISLSSVVGADSIKLPKLDGNDPPRFSAADSSEVPVLGMPDLVLAGLDTSDALKQSKNRALQASYRTGQSRSDLLPSVSYRKSRGPEVSTSVNGVDQHKTMSEMTRLTQPIIDIGRVRSWQSDVNLEDAAAAKHKAEIERVAAQVSKAVVDVATSRVNLDFSDEQLAALEEILEYTQKRVDAGATSKSDLERARTRVLAANQIRVELQALYRSALFELERLTGQVPVELMLPYLNQLPGLPKSLSEMHKIVEDNSPEIVALVSDVKSSRHKLGASQASLLPTLGFAMEKSKSENVQGTNPVREDERKLLVLNWQVSLGGREVYGIKSSSSELAAAEAKLDEERKKLKAAVDADFVAIQSSTIRLDVVAKEVASATKVLNATEEQLKNGRLVSMLEALDAVDRVYQAKTRLTQTIGQQMTAQVQLLSKMGMLADVTRAAEWQLKQ